mgnify:CR=1 FL=1
MKIEYDRATTVCASCYATGTTFGYTSVQLAELMHFAVMKVATENAQFREQLIQAVVWAIPRLKYESMLIAPKNRKADADALADLLERLAGREHREGAGEGDLPLGGEARRDADHVGLGNARLFEPLWKGILEGVHFQRAGEVCAEGDHIVVGLAHF